MSSGLECHVVERKPGEWFYLIENDLGEEIWDWREDATAYGPFGTESAAFDHIRSHHQNPGGFMVLSNRSYREDEVYAKLFDEAAAPTISPFR